MSRLILLGNPETKRTVYLEKGAEKAGVEIQVVDWKEFPQGFAGMGRQEEEVFLKIDPPRWDSCCLEELNGLVQEYEENLEQIAELGRGGKIFFLNTPEDIKALLDKRGCKRRLKEAGIPVTEEIQKGFPTAKMLEGSHKKGFPLTEGLLDAMGKQKIFQVFIKPNCGSGAAGVAAFRYEPGKGRMVLYTCGVREPVTGRLVNTKRLWRFTDREEVFSMLERLLRMDCIVERWYAKANHGRYSYDLRAVVQEGEVDFILARLSSGPITNLQLNNHPFKAEELGLPAKVWDNVTKLCCRAAGCFPGLRSVGIDILLERGSLRPRVIEMNGQGDLIYQDIYGENRIYSRQAEMMKRWMQERELWRGQK